MNSSNLVENTEIILEELYQYTSDYLKLLPEETKNIFVNQWQQLALLVAGLSTEDTIRKINELIYSHPSLRDEFWGNTDMSEINQVKFDPNFKYSIDNTENKSETTKLTVRIINEVINVGKKLEISNEKTKRS